jgi:hypothetical protein
MLPQPGIYGFVVPSITRSDGATPCNRMPSQAAWLIPNLHRPQATAQDSKTWLHKRLEPVHIPVGNRGTLMPQKQGWWGGKTTQYLCALSAQHSPVSQKQQLTADGMPRATTQHNTAAVTPSHLSPELGTLQINL